jgi:hypothetical protein
VEVLKLAAEEAVGEQEYDEKASRANKLSGMRKQVLQKVPKSVNDQVRQRTTAMICRVFLKE